jgi:hypothetical protein
MRKPRYLSEIKSANGKAFIRADDTGAIVQFTDNNNKAHRFRVDSNGLELMLYDIVVATGNGSLLTWNLPIQDLTGAVISRWPAVVSGADLTTLSGSALAPTSGLHCVDIAGTPAVTSISPSGWTPVGGDIVHFVPIQAFTWTTAGNIGRTGTAVVGKLITFMYAQSGGKWWPSYF